jgi:pimeloyl-ACP methyl ester carboxylesterase
MLRNGTFPAANRTFNKVVHVGHSFGSAQTYALANLYPNLTDGIVLTGFSMNGSFVNSFAARKFPTGLPEPTFAIQQCYWSGDTETSFHVC